MIYNAGYRDVISVPCNPITTERPVMSEITIQTIIDLGNTALTDVKLIPLTKGQFAIIDIEDYDQLMQCKWYVKDSKVDTSLYAVRKPDFGIVRMHRVIMDAPKGMEVDHINGNGLDNRRCNLRLCTRRENQINTNKPKTFKGKTMHITV